MSDYGNKLTIDCRTGKAVSTPMSAEEVSLRDVERSNAVQDPEYMSLRRTEYPSIGEQLDMMFWDQENGTTKWRDMIRGIKERYPKE